MTHTATASATEMTPIDFRNFFWVGLALATMIVVINLDQIWPLKFMHVMSGVLWTGIDLFMGFVLGPIVRVVSLDARRAIITRLTPKTVFIMPTLSIITGTTGWFHARQLGYLDLPWPQFGWVAAALAIITILSIQGMFYLLPTNVRVYLELRKPNPDGAKIGRLMSGFFYVVAFQGCMQIAIIVIMTKFDSGI